VGILQNRGGKFSKNRIDVLQNFNCALLVCLFQLGSVVVSPKFCTYICPFTHMYARAHTQTYTIRGQGVGCSFFFS